MNPEFAEMEQDLERVMFDREAIENMVDRLGKEISLRYRESVKERRLILIGVLKGSVIFLADLIRHVTLPLEVLFLQASSYGSGTESCGRVQINMELDKKLVGGADVILVEDRDIRGFDVLVVEDILDSGRTLKKLMEYFSASGAHSVSICTMLDKPARRVVDIKTDFVGYDVEDEFLVGYGLDYNEKYRNLPYIGVLKRAIYES